MGKKIGDLDVHVAAVAGWDAPSVFDLSVAADAAKLRQLVEAGKVLHVSDAIGEAAEELYHIDNPAQIDAVDEAAYQQYLQKFGNGTMDHYGRWVFYPWSGTLVHFPERDDLRRLRGSRNRNLITDDERQKLVDNKTIVILGLSVGSNVVESLLTQAIGSKYILVDMDSLSPTNLNRIKASYDQVGVHKVDVVAKKISELDPYLEQVHYKDGIDEKNLEEILSKHKPAIIVDEMDSLHMKVLIRMRAKELGIPVLMATDNGDDILLDIERYDTEAPKGILHGLLPQPVIEKVLKNEAMSRQEAGGIIGQYFVGLNNVPVRMIESLMEVGRTLPSWPQLGGAAALSGLYLAYAARRILLGQPLNSGRFLMGPEPQLNPEITSPEYTARKTELINMMMQRMRPPSA